MEGEKLWRLGGACSMLAGLLYLAAIPSGLLPLLAAGESPAALDEAATFYPLVHRVPLAFVLGGLEFGLAAILALALVPALRTIVEPASPALVRWMSTIAYLGFAVGAVSTLRGTDLAVRIASSYSSGDATLRATIAAIYPPASLTLDPWGLLEFGAVGLWIFVTCLLARRHALLAPGSAYLGMAVGILYWLQVVGEVLANENLVTIGSGLGIIAGGAWFMWVGRTLWRRAGRPAATPGGA